MGRGPNRLPREFGAALERIAKLEAEIDQLKTRIGKLETDLDLRGGDTEPGEDE